MLKNQGVGRWWLSEHQGQLQSPWYYLSTQPKPIQTQFKTQISPKGTGADTKTLQATTQLHHHRKLLSIKQGSHSKTQRLRKFQNGPPYLSVKNSFRWTVRGRTWSSPPCSVRSSSFLLVIPLSKCQHPGQTNSVQEGPNAVLPCR